MKRGFYASAPIRDSSNKVIGVVVMKKELGEMEAQLKSYTKCFFVDLNGVIFLSSDEKMLFKGLWPMDQKKRQLLVSSKQFGDTPFDTLLSQEVVDGATITLEKNEYLASRKVVAAEGWSIVLMTPANKIMTYRLAGVITTLLVFTIVMIPLIVSYKTARSVEKIRESEERFRQVTLSSRGWIWELDSENRYTYSSQAVIDILGYEQEEVVGKYYYDFYPPEDKELLTQAFGMFLERNEPFFRLFTKVVRRDGEKVILEATGYPTLDHEGNVIGFRGVSRDITDRKKAEEKLADALHEAKLQKEKFRMLVDNAPFGMILISKEGAFILLNPCFRELFGYNEEDVPDGRSWFRKAYPDADYRHAVIATWLRDWEKADPGEKRPRIFTVTCKNGEKKIVNFIPVKLTTGDYLMTIQDITERVLAAETLRKSERLYRSVIENINDTFYRSDIDGRLVMMSPSGAALFGYDSIEEMIGADIAEFFYVNPEDRNNFLSAIEKEGFVKDYEIKLRRRDGTVME